MTVRRSTARGVREAAARRLPRRRAACGDGRRGDSGGCRCSWLCLGWSWLVTRSNLAVVSVFPFPFVSPYILFAFSLKRARIPNAT